MRYALIGCGKTGALHLAAAKKAGLEIAAVCDRVYERALDLAGGDSSLPCRTVREVLSRSPQLVAIATGGESRAYVAKEALLSGADVILESPMAMNMRDAASIAKIAERKNSVLSVCCPWRFSPAVQELLNTASGEYLGDVFLASARVLSSGENKDGVFMRQSSGAVDLLLEFLGDVEYVSCFLKNALHPEGDAEDTAAAIFLSRSGALGTLIMMPSTVSESLSESFYLSGTLGSAVIRGNIFKNTADAEKAGYESSYRDTVSAIELRRRPLSDADSGMRCLKVLLACYESAALGRTVRIK